MEDNKEKIEKLELTIHNIENKLNKLMFYLPSVPQASGGIGVVYSHVKRLTDLGYDTMIIHDNKDYVKPTWLGEEYCNLKHVALDKSKMTVNFDDLLVYPEGFSNIMEQTKNLPCIKVVLCQSYLYVLQSLMPGISWANFGIRNVVVVQKPLQEYLEKVFKNQFDIKICPPAIDDSIFKPSGKIKKPIIAVSARDQSQLLTLAKHFYAAYPHYQMISFKDMRDMKRSDFASKLDECFLGVWIDRVAGFGTFPIECAKTNTPFIGLVPDIIPEYAEDTKGIWTNNIIDLADLVAQYTGMWLEDSEPQEILDGIKELAKLYTKEDEDVNVENIYSGYIETRKEEIGKLIEQLKNEKKDG